MSEELKDGWYWGQWTIGYPWMAMYLSHGREASPVGEYIDDPIGPAVTGLRIPTPDELTLQSTEIAQLRRDNAKLRTAVEELSEAMPPVIYIYDRGPEGTYWTDGEPEEGIYTTIDFAALLAPPTTEAPDVQQGAGNAGEAADIMSGPADAHFTSEHYGAHHRTIYCAKGDPKIHCTPVSVPLCGSPSSEARTCIKSAGHDSYHQNGGLMWWDTTPKETTNAI